MENFNLIWEQLWQHIDIIAVIIVLLSGMISKKYFALAPGSTAAKTLILSVVFITIYIVILHLSGQLRKEDYLKYFISYCFATSFYEMLLKRLKTLVKR